MPALGASPKATRLLAQVRVLPGGAATVYNVKGDHSYYRVLIADGWSSCSCPAVAGCSHLEAATLLHSALAAEGLTGCAS